MLGITRKVGEALVIGEMMFTVTGVGRKTVRGLLTPVGGQGAPRALTLHVEQPVSLANGAEIGFSSADTGRDRARIEILAPKEMPVHRKEVWDAIHGRS